MKNKFRGLLVLLVGIFLISGCSKKEKAADSDGLTDWAKIEKSGQLVIGVDDSFVPMGFRDENDKLVGFDIDLAKAVCKELGVKAKFQSIDWSMKETELENGTIDVIWNGYTMTDERAKQVAFSNPYLKNDQVVVTLKKYSISSYEDLSGKAFGAQEGSSGVDALESKPKILLDKIKDGEPVLYPTFTEAFLDLNSGRIEGLIIDSVFAEYYISHEKDKADYVIIPSEFTQEDYGVGVRKDDSKTLEKINGALKTVYDNGTTKKISEEWFGEDKVVAQP